MTRSQQRSPHSHATRYSAARRAGKRTIARRKAKAKAKRADKARARSRVHPLAQALKRLLQPLCQSRREPDKRILWTPLMLVLCAILLAVDCSPSLSDRFEQAQLSLGLLLPRQRRARTYQGFIKALHRKARLHEDVAGWLRQHMQQIAGPHWLREGFAAFAADSSKINCPRTRANEQAFGRGGKANGPPQQLLTTLWHMGLGLPWAWRADPVQGHSERGALRSMLGLLPRKALVVADAGFVGYELVQQLRSQGQHLLIRVGRNVSLLTQLGWAVKERGDTVYLWPSQDHRGGDRSGSKRRRKHPPLVLRLIRIPVPGKADVCLLSDLPQGQLSQQQAHRLYLLRWGVELFYRSLKQKLQRRKLCSAAPAQARLELHWSVLGVWVVGLLSVEAIVRKGHDPLSWSLAASLRLIRRAAKAPGGKADAQLLEHLGECLKDPYPRQHPKAARDWPHKRKQKPPGEPNVRPATPEEVEMAQVFHPHSAAA